MRNKLTNLEGSYFYLDNDLSALNSLYDSYFGMNRVTIKDKDKTLKLALEYKRAQAILNLIINDMTTQIKIFNENLYGLYEELKNKGE